VSEAAPRSESSRLCASSRAPSPTLLPVSRVEELTGDGPYAVSADGADLVLVQAGGKLRAFGGRCPHQGALLGEGELDGETLVCRNHRWRFSIETGARLGGPESLLACPVVERNGHILVDVSPLTTTRDAAASARRSVRDLPVPHGLPILGNALQLPRSSLHQVVERWTAEYGPMYVVRIGSRRVVVVSDPRHSVQVLRARPETYRRASTIGSAFQGMGIAGVFSAEGSAWRPQRRLAMEALSHRHLRSFYPTLGTVAARLLRRLEGAADRGESVDIVEELKRFTVDVTTALTFGHDVNTIEQAGGDVVQRRLELVFPVLTRRVFAAFPLWRLIRLPSDRRLDRAIAELRGWLGELVAEARARIDTDGEGAPTNFLEAMLVARDDAGQPFSDQMIFAT
jgi:nitrite reductase/ring-hydroxylating ferredoxin subunit